jgi:hypothetical protein
LTLLALGAPPLLALVVLVWAFSATENKTAIPNASASPLVAIGISGVPVAIAATQAPATPTPGLGPGTAYRIEGIVVDELGAPIPNVCIAIGPNGCQEHSPRTDTRGVYYIDFPAAEVDYDLHFTKDGYKEFTQRIKPTQNQVLNLVLGQ